MISKADLHSEFVPTPLPAPVRGGDARNRAQLIHGHWVAQRAPGLVSAWWTWLVLGLLLTDRRAVGQETHSHNAWPELQACLHGCTITLAETWSSPSTSDTWQFERLDRLSLALDGMVLAVDGLARAVYVIDRNGSLVHRLGNGPGDGPGDFRAITTAIPGPNRSVWAYDDQLERFSEFDLGSGTLRGVHPIDALGVLDDAFWTQRDELWVSGYRQIAVDRDVHRYSRLLQYLSSVGVGRKVRDPNFAHQLKGGTLTASLEGGVLYVQRNPVVLTAFDANGEVAWTMTPSFRGVPDAEGAYEPVSVNGRTGFRFRVDRWVYAIAGFQLASEHMSVIVVDNVRRERRVVVLNRSGRTLSELRLEGSLLTPITYDPATRTLYAVDGRSGKQRVTALRISIEPKRR